ncbi:pyruvate dehydrogenase complex dihydrolipoamide acetyltransferase [Chelatococcus asaccharovorans]|uniref:pyruvate dehydrogenase complex dihydrolipoamide acetyltransferase n=1 Tax=Chelatococcus asaccharovorans TaxID=28210 RepID=UPI00224C6DBD|nr:pyruvate dehydrogenase complex dihydrolipoamide acetyltransferase [Chelatococcus asaccharovorans]CAH1652369.1 Dihydrolipoyllysine-residue acetyltransferase component of pyruvate dehydrogenase complex [Chelatococcus asaccharovorans]CAH1686357.1 Dihydrolipoyllysine-residue acetyltransferase component of pyruvate dehydrogenase complex [Chelatococcus asaccharovorans]
MPVEVILPKVDMDMATGRISSWFFEEGATVAQGDVLFEIETDKAAMEIEAPASGVLRNVTGKVGVDIPVGAPVAWIYAAGEAEADAATAVAQATPPAETAKAAASALDAGAQACAASPAAGPSSCTGSPDGAAVRASPLARRLAREAGIDLSSIQGSGPRGRVVEKDVVAAKQGSAVQPVVAVAAPAVSPPAPVAPLAAPASDDQIKRLFAAGSYEEIPHDSMRMTIARRLTEAKQTIPHFYVTVDCELDALLKLRAELNADAPEKDGQPAYKLSVNDMVIKALALALKAVPDANVSWTEGAMLKHKQADVGVAVSIPGGLITPIVRGACGKTLSEISNAMKDLAARAKAKKLKPEEYQGGTTAVSNLGMFGVKDFAAIVNPPHATILAVGAGEPRPVVKAGQLAIATVMSVTLSTDHRAVDGALGAELLRAFKGYIEKPMTMLV